MKVLIIGSGGREHALAWRVAQSEKVDTVYVAPGNAGTELEEGVENIPLAAEDIDGLIEFAQKHQVGLTIVGPEAPLVAGVVDRSQQRDCPALAPAPLPLNWKAPRSLPRIL